jgi:tetratricopeptide (TPR) repeat protein
MTLLTRWLTSWAVGVVLLHASLAWALPSPKDIESAVQAGQYTQAETMLREVIQEKPQSAKAHYELGQVLAHLQRYSDAQTELRKAKEIDPTLKFAASPDKFNAVLGKVNDLAAPSTSVVMAPSVAPGTHAAAQAVPEPESKGGSSLTYVWIAIAGLVVLGLWLRRSAAANANPTTYAPAATPMGTPPAPRGFGAQYTPHAPQGGYPPQAYAPPTSGGSTMTGAVVGGLAGVAAGYALSKALEGDHHTAAPAAGSAPASNNSGYVPFDTPAPPDLGSFDAGSGADWDSADAGGSGDDW